MAASGQPAMHQTFKEIKIHTAKCDECNKHNSHTIYRCIDCSQQCCTPCWDKKGGDGTHLIASGSMNAQRPIIVKAEDVEKSKLKRKKKNVGGTKRATKPKANALKKRAFIEESDGGDSDIESQSSDLQFTDQESTQESDTPFETSSEEVVVQKDKHDEVNLPLPLTSKQKKAVKVSKKSSKTAVIAQQDGPVCSSKKRGYKRKHTASTDTGINADSSEFAWAFEHAAQEGKKRLCTTSTGSSAKTINHPVSSAPQDCSQTIECANYLLDLSRGSPSDIASSPPPKYEERASKVSQEPAVWNVKTTSAEASPVLNTDKDQIHTIRPSLQLYTDQPSPKKRAFIDLASSSSNDTNKRARITTKVSKSEEISKDTKDEPLPAAELDLKITSDAVALASKELLKNKPRSINLNLKLKLKKSSTHKQDPANKKNEERIETPYPFLSIKPTGKPKAPTAPTAPTTPTTPKNSQTKLDSYLSPKTAESTTKDKNGIGSIVKGNESPSPSSKQYKKAADFF